MKEKKAKVKEKPVKEKKVKEKKVKEEKAVKEKKASSPKKRFNKNTLMGVTVAGLLAIVAVYAMVYLDYTERTEEIEASNAALKQTLNELEQYYVNMEQYQMEIGEFRTAIVDIMEAYPADVREEDILMLAVQMQEKNVIAYESISMESNEGVYVIPRDEIAAADIEGYEGELVFAQKKGSYLNITNYDNLKSCIAQIYASPHRISIDEIMYTKNETDGTLEGNINLSFYSARGTGKEYVLPDIAQYLSGTSDLFRTDKVAAKIAETDGGENGEESEETAEEEKKE